MNLIEKVSFLLEIHSKNFLAPTNWGGYFLSPIYHLLICKSAWKYFQIYRFDVSKSENSVCKFRILAQKQPKSRFSAWDWGGVTFVANGTLFWSEEIVSMPAPPAACGYARLKPCDYAGRKRPALLEKLIDLAYIAFSTQKVKNSCFLPSPAIFDFIL